MRFLLLALLVLVPAIAPAASPFDVRHSDKPAASGEYHGGGRTGGDTWNDAVAIPSLPFSDTGNTCGFADDQGYDCPYIDNNAPDVFYVYQPSTDQSVDIDLCNSLYDTLVLVWEDTIYNIIACNDDAGCGYSGYQSTLRDVQLQAGHTYWIIVDGYGNSCGDYILDITLHVPCVVECPPGALQEGEPPCVAGPDYYNGGCQYENWTLIPGGVDGCASMCGKSCTFIYQGASYRDTDWYTLTAGGGEVSLNCTAEFPLQLILIYNADCADLQYVLDTAFPCEPAHVTYTAQPGQVIWPWVGPSVFTGVPPESDYLLEVCGILPAPPVPAEASSWGRIKRSYR